MNRKKILIMGLPGAGKTTLAKELAPLIGAVHFNADDIRENVNKDLGFTEEDRIEQARRMGFLCDVVNRSGQHAIADFVCPTVATRNAFNGDALFGEGALVIWVDRIKEGRFDDTNKLFEEPMQWDLRVGPEGTPRSWAEKAANIAFPVFDPKSPTALYLGRYQPFHDGHLKLIEEGLNKTYQACIAVRDTYNTDDKNPFDFDFIKSRIDAKMAKYKGRYVVVQLPNITNIFYGRDVGYKIEMIDLDEATKNISATDIRKDMNDESEA